MKGRGLTRREMMKYSGVTAAGVGGLTVAGIGGYAWPHAAAASVTAITVAPDSARGVLQFLSRPDLAPAAHHRPATRPSRRRGSAVLHPEPGRVSPHRAGCAWPDDPGPIRPDRLVLTEHRLPGEAGHRAGGPPGPDLPRTGGTHLVGGAGRPRRR